MVDAMSRKNESPLAAGAARQIGFDPRLFSAAFVGKTHGDVLVNAMP